MTAAGALRPARSRPRILVVDDEPGNLFTFRRVFASH